MNSYLDNEALGFGDTGAVKRCSSWSKLQKIKNTIAKIEIRTSQNEQILLVKRPPSIVSSSSSDTVCGNNMHLKFEPMKPAMNDNT